MRMGASKCASLRADIDGSLDILVPDSVACCACSGERLGCGLWWLPQLPAKQMLATLSLLLSLMSSGLLGFILLTLRRDGVDTTLLHLSLLFSEGTSITHWRKMSQST
jgi:hypothetical protein